MKKLLFLLPFLLIIPLFLYHPQKEIDPLVTDNSPSPSPTPITLAPSPTSTPTLTPTPTPTPKGFCTTVPTLMYHHIQKTSTSLTVTTDNFAKQMQYLKDKNYNVITMNDLLSSFSSEKPLPKKSVLLTFDDGYVDFYADAYPILQSYGFHATMFIPTGLMDNPGYLSWQQIKEMAGSNLILFANHTWSHSNMKVSENKIESEISTADTQLSEKGYNSPKIFAYPYGLTSTSSETYLTKLGYQVAFTTVHGTLLCKSTRLTLPRIRIGNASLSSYGL